MALFRRKPRTDATPAAPAPAADATPSVDLAGDYTVDAAHTRIGFSARHAMVTTVRGSFGEFEGTAHLDPADVAGSHVELRIQVASISTGQAQRDEHLRTADFLEAEKFPEITFRSTAVAQADDDTYDVTGDLTIKGVSRPVTVPFTLTGMAKDPFGNQRVGFEGAATINRADWGLTYNAALETGGVLISDKVKLEFDVSAIQQVAASV